MQSKAAPLYPSTYLNPGAKGIIGDIAPTGPLGDYINWSNNVWMDAEKCLAPRPMFRKYSLWADIPGISTYSSLAGEEILVSGTTGVYRVNGDKLNNLGNGGNAPFVPPSPSPIKTSYLNNKIVTALYYPPYRANVYDLSTNTYGRITSWPDNAWINHSAFNRIWAADIGLPKLYWSVLNDPTDWSGAGSGSLDLTPYLGKERITSIQDFNNYLVVFTNQTILVFQNPFSVTYAEDGTGTAPANMSLKDKIDGLGCLGPFAVVNIGEDLIFAGLNGLHSIGRVIQDGGSNPLSGICTHMWEEWMARVSAQQGDTFQTGTQLQWHPRKGLLTFVLQYQLYLIYMKYPIEGKTYPTFSWSSFLNNQTGSYSGQLIFYHAIYPQGNPAPYNVYPGGDSFLIHGSKIDYTDPNSPVVTYGMFFPSTTKFSSQHTLAQAPMFESEYQFHIHSPWLEFARQEPDSEVPVKKAVLTYRLPRRLLLTNNVDYVPVANLPYTFRMNVDYDIKPSQAVNWTTQGTYMTYINSDSYYLSRGPMAVDSLPVEGTGTHFQYVMEGTVTDTAQTAFALKQLGFQYKTGKLSQGLA